MLVSKKQKQNTYTSAQRIIVVFNCVSTVNVRRDARQARVGVFISKTAVLICTYMYMYNNVIINMQP